MSLILSVPSGFLRRDHLPMVCFLTGKTERVAHYPILLHYLPVVTYLLFICIQLLLCVALEGLAVVFLLFGLLGLYFLTERRSVELPATTAYPRNRRLDIGVNLAMIVVPLACWFGGMWWWGGPNRTTYVASFVAMGTMLLINLLWTAVNRSMRTRLVLRGKDRIDLIFPDSAGEIYERYRQAYVKFLEKNAGPPPPAQHGEEVWTEPVNGAWDQSNRKV